MHLPTILLSLLLTPFTLADQAPLVEKAQGWFDKAKSYIPAGAASPMDAGASVVAAKNVERINVRNWQRKLAPKIDTEEEWLVYFTGGNKTCFGRCGEADLIWNESVPLLTALPQSSTTPKLRLGQVDCEKDDVLCTTFAAGVPSIWHFRLPTSSSESKTPLHIIPLSVNSTVVTDITSIPSHSKSRYLEFEEYIGVLHPIDGTLAKMGLLTPMGYGMWVIGNTPSWVMMIVISFVSRQIMSRRMTGGTFGGQVPTPEAVAGVGAGQPVAGTGGAPASAAGAGTGAQKQGGGKKRK